MTLEVWNCLDAITDLVYLPGYLIFTMNFRFQLETGGYFSNSKLCKLFHLNSILHLQHTFELESDVLVANLLKHFFLDTSSGIDQKSSQWPLKASWCFLRKVPIDCEVAHLNA